MATSEQGWQQSVHSPRLRIPDTSPISRPGTAIGMVTTLLRARPVSTGD